MFVSVHTQFDPLQRAYVKPLFSFLYHEKIAHDYFVAKYDTILCPLKPIMGDINIFRHIICARQVKEF